MRSKTKQRYKFDIRSSRINKPSSCRPSGHKRARNVDDEARPSNSKKKAIIRAEEDSQVLNPLSNEMEFRLSNKIKQCLEANGSLQQLKEDWLSVTRLERVLVTEAARKANLKVTTIEYFIRRSNKENYEYWTEFVSNNFERLSNVSR
ncbi:MAG: hypothetical protein EXX96DRAFT_487691 [Benjaminiella poitrasii]|nr:MAG: hypothetical protein EXX96DRAFT_487691 [Benjaminiella poitrasii]